MFQREGNSEFVNHLVIGKRGTIIGTKRIAQGVETKEDALNVLNKFDKSEDIPDEYIKEHTDRIENDEDPKEVVGDFFQDLHENKKDANKITIHTAQLLRKAGMFRRSDKDVYQDLKTSDFWKISDDKKNVVRVFKEVEGGISDKSASKKESNNEFVKAEQWEVLYKNSVIWYTFSKKHAEEIANFLKKFPHEDKIIPDVSVSKSFMPGLIYTENLEDLQKIIKDLKIVSKPSSKESSKKDEFLEINKKASEILIELSKKAGEVGKKKPKVKLVGADSNIFNLLGIASSALKKAGQREEAAEMQKKVFAAGSFDQALAIITDYVDAY